MATRTAILMMSYLIININFLFSQNEIMEAMEQATTFLSHNNYQEAAAQLTKALRLVNEKLLAELKVAFPDPLSGWRSEEPSATISSGTSAVPELSAKQSYFKKGGGPSIDIEMVANSMKIPNIRSLLSSPSMIHRVADKIQIKTIAERTCLEEYDPIDRYGKLTFVPSSTLLITIIGHDMKDTETLAKFAEKIKWSKLETIFP